MRGGAEEEEEEGANYVLPFLSVPIQLQTEHTPGLGVQPRLTRKGWVKPEEEEREREREREQERVRPFLWEGWSSEKKKKKKKRE